jgi:hypothetical protein
VEPEASAGASPVEPTPHGVDYVADKPEGWTLESCPHYWNLDRLEPRPHPRRRGAQFFYIECPWCRTSATLDAVLTGLIRGLVTRTSELEERVAALEPGNP